MLSIHIEKNKLVETLSVANEIAPASQSASILANVYINVENLILTIRTTNLNIGFETKINIEKGTDGTILIPCDKLIQIIKSFPSGLLIIEQIDEKKVRILSSIQKNIEYTLFLIKESYPDFVSCPNEGYVSISQKDFRSLISKTIFAVSHDETRININGILLDTNDNLLTLVGTDGRRLSYVELSKKIDTEQLSTDKGIIVPIKILNLIERYANEGQIGLFLLDKNNLYIKLFDYYFSTSLISEEFPNYKRVIPERQQYLIEIDNKKLSASIKQVAVLSEKTKRIVFTILENKLVINSDQIEVGAAKTEVDCSYNGPDTKIALNYSYVLEPLKAMSEAEEIVIGFTENNRAISLYPKIDDSKQQEQKEIHVIMPMQLD